MLRAFWRAPTGKLGLLIVAILALVAIFAPILLGDHARAFDVMETSKGPSLAHPLGTDQLGRDLLSRLIVATQLSLGLAVFATALGAFAGITAGAAAAMLSPGVRQFALRTIDTVLAFPRILVAMFVTAVVGLGIVGTTAGVALALSFFFARVAASLTLSVAARDYIAAARVVGVTKPRLLLRYVLPNIAETLSITTTVAISTSIVTISSLSFLGLGVQPPAYDWGRMLTEGVQAFYQNPIAALAPAAAIAFTAVAFGLTGEALARAANPVLWTNRPDDMTDVVGSTPLPIRRNDEHAPAVDETLVLEVRDLAVLFPVAGIVTPVVHDVTFSLRQGERLGIVGESGSGKTTTAMAVARLIGAPGIVQGSVEFGGEWSAAAPTSARSLARQLAVVFQDPMSALNPALTVGVQLTEKVEHHEQMRRPAARRLALQRLSDVHMPSPERQLVNYANELSGGMRQRVMIAMGLMMLPSVLIADEPTTALDVTIQAQIMDVLAEVNREHGVALLLISHNLALVSQNCDRILVMYCGTIVEDLSAADLVADPLHPYTRALLAAVPHMTTGRDGRLHEIPGQMPQPHQIPAGCPYHPRCPLALDRCRTEIPALRSRPPARRVACWVANEDLP